VNNPLLEHVKVNEVMADVERHSPTDAFKPSVAVKFDWAEILHKAVLYVVAFA
jgi:hypothetical protein